ncbi:MAG TPA: 50S ribosomal protein L23 [Candidatus Binatia bacterium]|nr:50S ribosomal protein L23 [Candidatus Binatia bacterium]
MGLLDKITGKAEEPKKTKKVAKKKADNVLDMVKEEPKADKKPVALKEDTGRAHRVLRQYHLSEKTNAMSSLGRYVFVVDKKANKIEIKKAVENVYDVHVANVNIVNTKGKNRRYGRAEGRTSDWKKAIVTLKAGEKISGLAEGV